MRILFFHRTPAAIGGGANQYVMDLLPRLRHRGFEVALAHSRNRESEFRGTGYLFDEMSTPGPLVGKARARLEAILEDFQPDIVQMHDVPNPEMDAVLRGKVPVFRFVHNHRSYCSGGSMTWRFPLRICREAHGRRCLARHLACGCGEPNPATNFLRFAQTGEMLRALRAADGVQAVSREIRENLVRNGVPEERVHLLPAPVPAPGKVSGKGAAAEGRRVVLHVGGLLLKKGVWVAIRMLRKFPEDCDLVFAGGGEQRFALEAHIKKRGLGDRVRIFPAPTLAEWEKLYHRAALVVMPSLWNEPLGLSALRATAYGKPVVAFRAGGPADWIEDGVTGVLVPIERRREFPEVVGELLGDPKRLAALGASAALRWEKLHQIESHLDALAGLYQAALSDK